MANAFVKRGAPTLARFAEDLGSTRASLQENLRNLQSAFEQASENWKDKNADTTREFLENHARVMAKELEHLERMSRAAWKLAEIAEQYQSE